MHLCAVEHLFITFWRFCCSKAPKSDGRGVQLHKGAFIIDDFLRNPHFRNANASYCSSPQHSVDTHVGVIQLFDLTVNQSNLTTCVYCSSYVHNHLCLLLFISDWLFEVFRLRVSPGSLISSFCLVVVFWSKLLRSIFVVTIVFNKITRPEFKFPAKIDLAFSQILAVI